MNFRLFHPRQFLRCCIAVLAIGGTGKAEDLLDAPGPGYFHQREEATRQSQSPLQLLPWQASVYRPQILKQLLQSHGNRDRTVVPPAALRVPQAPGELPTLPAGNPFEQPIRLFGHPK